MIGPQDILNFSKHINQQLPTEETVHVSGDYVVEHLDYSYVKECSDTRQLNHLLSILKSGKEGNFPDLEKFIENRIVLLDPEYKFESKEALEKSKSDAIQDFNNWTAELKEKESLSKFASKLPLEIKGAESLNLKSNTSTRTRTNTSTETKRIKGSDYRSWDKLNIEEELKKLDDQDSEKLQFIPSKPASNLSKTPLVNSTVNMNVKAPSNASRQELEYLADLEKVKGNECYKAQEYDDAVAFYTRSLRLLERAHVYTNRSSAFMKLKNFERAENDSSSALELKDSENIFKAYIRRAEARRKRGKLAEALKDLDEALKLDPTSKVGLLLKRDITKEYQDREGELLCLKKDVKNADEKKSRMKIVEVEEKVEEDESYKPNELLPSSITEILEEELPPLHPTTNIETETLPLEPESHQFLSLLQNQTMEIVDVQEEDDADFDNCFEQEKQSLLKFEIQDITKEEEEEDYDFADCFHKSINLSQFPVPKSASELEVAWKSLGKSKNLYCDYIQQIPPKDLTRYLSNVANTDVVTDTLMILSLIQDKIKIISILESLLELDRLKLILKFLSKSQKQELKSLWTRLESDMNTKQRHEIAKKFDFF